MVAVEKQMRKARYMTDTNFKTSTTTNWRASSFYSILQEHFCDDPEESIVELLTKAMHWCETIGRSFEDALESAFAEYSAESKTEMGR